MYPIHSGNATGVTNVKLSPKSKQVTSASTPRREKKPAGLRFVVLRQLAHTGTDSLNVVSVRPILKKRVTRVSCISF